MLSSPPPESSIPSQRPVAQAAINQEVPSRPPAEGKRRRKSRRGWYLLLVLLLLAGAAGFLYLQGQREKPITVTAEPALRRTIVQLVSATGKIQPETEVKISPEVAGEIIELPVVDGQPVKKGDLLIRIKPDNYLAQVAQEEAAISAAKALCLQNQAQLLKAQEDLKRYTDLYNRKVINDTDMISYRTIADVAAATLQASQAGVKQAESSLNQGRDLLSKTSIYSPIDGRISLLSVKLGERVVATGEFQGTEVMRVADLTKMEARVNVNENDVVNVKPGDEANISIDAYPNRVFRGEVYQIANTAVTTGENTTDEVTNFEVRIHIRLDGASLRPGMSATADVETATVHDAVAVPIQAVTVRNLADKLSPEERDKEKLKAAASAQAADNNSVDLEKNKAATDRDKAEAHKLQKVVFAKTGETVHPHEVATGIADNTYIEIKSGVQPGESIVSGPYRAISRLLKDGSKVVLQKAVQ
jgi:HlyD family secretion protein